MGENVRIKEISKEGQEEKRKGKIKGTPSPRKTENYMKENVHQDQGEGGSRERGK